MIDFQIRPATNDDASSIGSMIFNIWRHEYGFKVKVEDYPDLKSPEDYYQKNGGHFLIASYKGRVVGTIACDFLFKEYYALKRMFVDKEYRKNGIAQALLDEILGKISKAKTNFSIFLSTKENEAIAAKNLYLKNGFKVISKNEVPETFPFFYEDDLFMMRQR